MADRKRVVPLIRQYSGDIYGLRIGTVMGTDEDGRALVTFGGNDQERAAARFTSCAKEKLLRGCLAGREVLLGFDNGDSSCPIIIDTLSATFEDTAAASDRVLEVHKPETIEVDRKRLVLDAEEEVVLRCGEASITLTSAGKVLIKGNYLASRSSGANSIKGSSVRIN